METSRPNLLDKISAEFATNQSRTSQNARTPHGSEVRGFSLPISRKQLEFFANFTKTNSVPDVHDRTNRATRGSQTRVTATAWLETFATLHETGMTENCVKTVHTTRERAKNETLVKHQL